MVLKDEKISKSYFLQIKGTVLFFRY